MRDDETTFEVESRFPTETPKRAYVAVLDGGPSAMVPLREGEPVTVGRSSSCSITVEDRGVSRLQATITWDGKRGLAVEDHGSKNGTFVDGRRITSQRVDVGEGRPIGIGPMTLAVFLPKEAGDEPARPSNRAFVTADPAMEAIVRMLERAATKDATILLLGETGVGKEVMARFVHDASPRKKGPFVALNCGSVPESLAESTLFGHERGAFTGALARHEGVFERANRGTLFLDEVGELSAATQTRLLRVLEERRVTRLGGTNAIPVDVRIVAATHRDLPVDVEAGRFRQDLLYRLDVVRVRIPPLRERPDDVLPLARHFLRELASEGELRFSDDALAALRRARFPGNVRELRNAVHRGVALAHDGTITAEDLGLALDPPRAPENLAPGAERLVERIEESERKTILEALEACGGNQTHAAKRLGIARRTLIYKLEKYGLKPKPGEG